MAASPSSVITLGLGAWGSPSLVITLGYGAGTPTTDACSAWPRGAWPSGAWPDTCPVTTGGSGGEKKRRKKRKGTVLRFSDFAGREEYEKAVREAVIREGILQQEPAEDTAPPPQLADTIISTDMATLIRLQREKDDEEAMLMLLMMMAVK